MAEQAYQPQQIEPKWQRQWEESALYHAHEGGNKPKYYCLDFFPYPSGEGLHVGHCRNYVPTDVLSRYKRMCGYNVLHPMGWDAFGEPAEQFAVRHGVHPRLTTDRNSANYRRQMTIVGISFDWSREIDSSKPEYYRWTQWFFKLLFQRGLAYRDANRQWWCPTCQTTLSSHEAAGGVCWRGHTGLTRREIPAWYFKITAYADRLLEGLERIDWPDKVKAMQRNWIGRSEGVEIVFPLVGAGEEALTVFTTRADTLFGVTFMALAPEHPLVNRLTTPEQRAAVEEYLRQAAQRSEIERMDETRQKTGVFSGGYALNPLTQEKVPVWIADYVLMGYGSGAVMGVPAHDPRDFEFAGKYALPVRQVIVPAGGGVQSLTQAYTEEGVMVHSGAFNGLPWQEGARRIAAELEGRRLGKRAVQYRMRDWLISRQRYWGTPIPILHCPACGMLPVPDEQLPVLLPVMENFQPDGSGRSPLARLPDFVNTICPQCAGPAQRETDTMGGFACSSWYYLRFASPHYPQGPWEESAMRYWAPPDLYVGGTEHAVLHLLYSRFWVKALADAGLLPFDEPFPRLLNQGNLLGADGLRMSKSRGNVITPDSMVQTYGADALRVYELFMAPFDQDVDWSVEGIKGARRFLNRVWNLYIESIPALNSPIASAGAEDADLLRRLHQTIRDVTERIETLRFNTMISTLMEFSNLLIERQRQGAPYSAACRQCLETLLLLLAPAAPHIAEELWTLSGHPGSVHTQNWPAWDAALAQSEMVEVAVQVNGKLCSVIALPKDAAQEQVQAMAMAEPRLQQRLQGRQIVKVIYAPGKVVNIVAR